jgi:RND superfamily putative drug exporter
VATFLYRLGRLSFRKPWAVIGIWLVLMVGILGGGFALGGQTQESFAIPGTESQEAIDRLAAVFPEAAGASAQVVVQVPDGDTVQDAEYTDAIEESVTDFAAIDGVDEVLSPFNEYATNAVSEDNSTAIITVQLSGQTEEVDPQTLTDIRSTGTELEDAGLVVEYGGTVFQDVAYGITPTEIIGVVFAGLVLFITFGSLLAAGMPLLTAIVGIGVAMGGVIAVSAFTTISSATPLLALMIGLAVGIDYGLFILSRHRNQLGNGMDPEESAGTSVATAGSAVVFAGVTVIIALLGLMVVQIPFLTAMGISAAAAVLLAILVSLTMLPALMGLAGSRLAPKAGSRAARRATSHDTDHKSFGEKWVGVVLKFPIVAVIAVVGILGTLAIPAFSLTLALPDGSSETKGSTARDSYDLISDGFTEGRNGPLIVLVDITQTTDILNDLDSIAAELRVLDDVSYVSQGLPNPEIDTAIIQVIPVSGPADPETTELVERIRELAPEIEDRYNTAIAVTGSTAVQIDISSRLNNALLPFGIIVVGLSIVLLMMVFRSVFVPLKAAAGFLLSVLASFGVVVAIFQWGWFADLLHVEPGPILSFMPILLMAVLFGLAMDYEVFLVSGMRENYVHTGDARGAIVRGFSGAARVVTAAALIMFFVFAAFVPEGAGVIKVIALGLAVGILTDAFLVRMTLVPAAMALMGRAAWWMPRWLGKILPNVDIEGENLREHRLAVDWTAEQHGDAITANNVVVGSNGTTVGPLSAHVTAGSIAVVSGSNLDRTLLSATLSGRVAPLSGQLQVAGNPLPSEASRVTRHVAVANIGEVDQAENRTELGEQLIDRIRLTHPWHRGFSARRAAHEWISRAGATLTEHRDGSPSGVVRAGLTLTEHSNLNDLPQLERAVALALVALAEGTPVVIVDQSDAFADEQDEITFLSILDSLAPATTTIIFGTPVPSRARDRVVTSREVAHIDLYSFERKGALL